MEDFNVSMLSVDSAFNNHNHHNLNNHNNSNNHNNTSIITHTTTTAPHTAHHHKDHMLGAGSTPATPFMYEMPPQTTSTSSSISHHNKASELSCATAAIKQSDYAAYASCIQQSAVLDHRVVGGGGGGALETSNMDGGVSLSSICDLKFSSPPNASLNTDTNFKQLGSGTALNAMDNNSSESLAVGPNSFASLIFSRQQQQQEQQHIGAINPKDLQNCGGVGPHTAQAPPPSTHAHYLTLKSAEAEDKMDFGIGSTTANTNNNQQQQHHHHNNNHNLQHLQNDTLLLPPHASPPIANYFGGNGALEPPMTNPDYNANAAVSTSAENQITTTTLTTIANTASNNQQHHNNTNHNSSHNKNINNNNIINMNNNRATVHSIEVLAASACSTAAAAAAQPMTPTTLTTVTSDNNINSSNLNIGNSNINKVPKEELQNNHANHHYSNISSINSINSSNNSNNSNNNISYHSSDCDDSMSSEDEEEFIDLEMHERIGYQDNTSSHSQQSGGGGTSTTSNSAGGAMLNGVGGSNQNPAGGGYMCLLPPAVGAASSSGGGHHGGTSASAGCGGGHSGGHSGSGGGGNGIDFKHLFEELCPVCGDKVSGYHYGLLTCESCKGFFKRTVQNKKVYTCVAERSCHIDKTQRKRCPYCRFQKCLEVGMKLEAVRADRMRGGRNKFGPMYKRDRARKLQVMRQRQLALQALQTSIGSTDMKATPLAPGYNAYPNMNIKQEIQIPQVSSLTQSPDSSPSPIAIALGQVSVSAGGGGVIATPMNGGGGSVGGGGGGNNSSSSSNNSNTTSDGGGINRGGGGGSTSNCHDTGTGSLQNASESKLCFDSGTHPSSTADSVNEPLRVSPMIRDFVQSIDDREWQTQLFALLQKQTYNQVEVDLFELMCKVLDQNLFSQVDWARNTVFFKDLKVDDQMKLLQHSWSDMLVLDHLHQRIHNGLPDETQLNNGQVFNLLGLGLLGVPQLSDYFNELQTRLQDLKFDMGDYVCMKFLILLNPDVRGIVLKKTVLEGHENVQAALLDYTLTCYPSVTDKFSRLLNILPDIHAMASRGEEHLYSKHCAGSAPTQTLLMEMLHAKRKV